MTIEMEQFLRQLVFPVSPPHPCPYLPDQSAQQEVFLTRRLDPEDYHMLMQMGWRRSGSLFYRPCCPSCDACTPIRVRTDAFRRSRSQRRVWRRNPDVRVSVAAPELTQEKHDLYVRYLRYQHDGTMGESLKDLHRFLYASPVHTLETCYRIGGRLVGVGTLDVSATAASTVYFFWDPEEHRRSLGTFSALWEIEWARREGLCYYYLGYFIQGLPSMAYKANFRPHEVLTPDGTWVGES